MHEMGHGLNFAGTMSYGSSRCGGASNGCWGQGTGYPGIYDRFVENGAGQTILNTGLFPNPSAALGSQLTSSNLYFYGANANAANGGSRVKIYAPPVWAEGSSYSHLDYNTFASTANRLMVYAISAASSVHDPGPVAMGLLKDLGWNLSNPAPTLTGLNPSSATAGGPAFSLTVNGTGFVTSSVVRWKGVDRPTHVCEQHGTDRRYRCRGHCRGRHGQCHRVQPDAGRRHIECGVIRRGQPCANHHRSQSVFELYRTHPWFHADCQRHGLCHQLGGALERRRPPDARVLQQHN